MIKKLKNKILKSALANFIISFLIYLYVKFVEKTTRWQKVGHEHFINSINSDGSILCSWHQRIIMLSVLDTQKKPVNALVSMHRDGRIIADLLRRFKFKIVSGSSNKNAKAAAINLMRCLENKEPVAIIPDGPRGPAQKLSVSPVYFASKTGCPVVACAYSIKNSKIIEKSWDKLMVPMPFSKGAFVFSEPFFVPKDLSEKELEVYRKKFENILKNVTKKADKMVGRA